MHKLNNHCALLAAPSSWLLRLRDCCQRLRAPRPNRRPIRPRKPRPMHWLRPRAAEKPREALLVVLRR